MGRKLTVGVIPRPRGRRGLAFAALVCMVSDGVAAPAHQAALRVQRSSSTGVPTFLTAAEGGAIPVKPSPGRSGVRPDDFLAQYGHVFGVTDPSRELVLARVETDWLGHTHSSFEQVHQGVPVFSGVLKIHQDAAGQVVAANGRFYQMPPALGTEPAITVADAVALAAESLEFEIDEIVRGELVVVDPGWYGDPPRGPRLAYYVIVADASGGEIEGLFIDAQKGEVLDRWSMLCRALDRRIHDGGGTSVIPGPLARGEGDPPVADPDVNAAYDYAGDTYDYFFRGFGRDGLDGSGGPLVATVNSTAIACPNAAYSFTLYQAAFCTGVVSDDMVAHELTHGITQHAANLIYQNQPGQLNESFSDVFGELVDLFNGDAAFVGVTGGPPNWPTHPTGPGQDAPNDARIACSVGPSHTNGVRWLFAEDANAFTDALRDLWDPECYGDPDRANSPEQTCSLSDNGGVHSGSGVPNHAFAMLTDGKAFNGYMVSGIGPIKSAAVWYRALTVYLTVSSDFEDAYYAFNQSAADLIGTLPNDPRTGLPSDSVFTAADAAEVDKALLAVEMNTEGACGETIPVLDSTPPFQCAAPEAIYANDFESGAAGWTVSNSSPPTPYDWTLTTEPLPFGRAGVAWLCEDRNVGSCAENPGESAIHSLYSPVIALPAGANLPVLTFAHFVELEPQWDGGDVRLSVNGGPWQKVPSAGFHHNPYNRVLFTAGQFNTNPYAGELAFTHVGGDWGTSLIDLSLFAGPGDTVQVRFDFSKDHCFGLTGWFLDDFAVYHCPASGDCNSNGVPDDVDIAEGPSYRRFLSQPPNRSSGNPSDIDGSGTHAFADNFLLLRPRTIGRLRIWGGYFRDNLAPPDHFRVIFHEDDGGLPGAVIAAELEVPTTRVMTGERFLGSSNIIEYEFTLTLANPVTLPPGRYFVEILNDTTGSTDTFIWERGTVGDIPGMAGSQQAPGVTWVYDVLPNMSLELYGTEVGADCDADGVPDECQPATDCNANGRRDPCDACGDHDGDGDADLADYAVMAGCLAGPNVPAGAACTCLLDADGDQDLDMADYASLQICLMLP